MKRTDSGIADTTLQIASRLPWWLHVCLAVGFYFLFHALASQAIPAPTVTKQLASILKYLLPALLLIAAVLSAIQRKRRANFFAHVPRSNSPTAAGGISWQEFELVIGEAFRQQGYTVQETRGSGADGCTNLILTRQSETLLVQCKQWKAVQVSIRVVRELYGLMEMERAAGGYVVTCGRFTKDAEEFASKKNIGLIDGEALRPLIRQMRKANPAQEAWATVGVGSLAKRTDAALSCPKCGSEMVRRVAERGAKAGAAFWGCAKFPGCNGTRAA